MGSWNQTCAVTNLPIKWYDEVVLILLEHSVLHEGFFPYTYYIDDNCTPLYFAIRGKYDDYGGIESIQNAERIANYLNGLGMNKVFSCEAKGLAKEINEIIHEENCFILTQGQKQYITYTFIKADVYDFLIAKVGSRIPYEQTKTYAELLRSYLVDKQCPARLVKEIYEATEKISADSVDLLREYFDTRKSLDDMYRMVCSKRMDSEFLRYCKGDFPEFADEFTDLQVFAKALSLLRKGWLCHSGAGSQNSEMQLHKDLADFVSAMIEEKQREMESLMGEDFNGLEETLWWRR